MQGRYQVIGGCGWIGRLVGLCVLVLLVGRCWGADEVPPEMPAELAAALRPLREGVRVQVAFSTSIRSKESGEVLGTSEYVFKLDRELGAIRVDGVISGQHLRLVSVPGEELMWHQEGNVYARYEPETAWEDRLQDLLPDDFLINYPAVIGALISPEIQAAMAEDMGTFKVRAGDDGAVLYVARGKYMRVTVTLSAEAPRRVVRLLLETPARETGDARACTVELRTWEAVEAAFGPDVFSLAAPTESRHVPRGGFLFYTLSPESMRDDAQELAEWNAITRLPLPSPEEATTWEDMYRVAKARTQRHTLAVYMAEGHRDPAWDADAIEVITAVTDVVSSGRPHASLAPLLPAARRVVAAGCDDPIALYYSGWIEERAGGDMKTAIGVFDRAWELGKDRDYAPIFRYFMLRRQIRFHARNDKDYGPYKDAYFAQMLAVLVDPDTTHEEHRMVAEDLGDTVRSDSAALAQYMLDSLTEELEMDAGLKHLIRGAAHLKLAWTARGGGYSGSVSEDGWELFRSHSEAAYEELTASWEARQDLPETAYMMIDTIKGLDGDWQEMRTWFDRGVRANIDCASIYGIYTFAHYPRWHGSEDILMHMGREWLAYPDYERYVTTMFFAYVMHAFDYNDRSIAGWDRIQSEPGLWEMIDRALTGMVAANNRYLYPEDARENHLQLAWRMGDYAAVRRVLAAMKAAGQEPDAQDAWERGHASLADILRDAEVLQGPREAALRRARELFIAGSYERAEAAFAACLEAAETDTERAWIADFRTANRIEAAFYDGDWVDLIGDDLSGWQPAVGEASVTTPGRIDTLVANGGETILTHRADFGNNYELRGVVSEGFFQLDIHRTPWGKIFSDNHMRMRMERRKGTAWAEVYDFFRANERESLTSQRAVTGELDFRIVVWEDTATLYIGDILVFEDAPITVPDDWDYIYLGIFFPYSQGQPTWLRDLQIRILDEKPEVDLTAQAIAQKMDRIEKTLMTGSFAAAKAAWEETEGVTFAPGDQPRLARVNRWYDIRRRLEEGETVDLVQELNTGFLWHFIAVDENERFRWSLAEVDGALRLHAKGPHIDVPLPLPLTDYELTATVTTALPSSFEIHIGKTSIRPAAASFYSYPGDDTTTLGMTIEKRRFAKKTIPAATITTPVRCVFRFRGDTITVSLPDAEAGEESEFSAKLEGEIKDRGVVLQVKPRPECDVRIHSLLLRKLPPADAPDAAPAQ